MFLTDFFKRQKSLKYQYVHIMINDKFSLPFIEFMNKNFDNKKQCFVYFIISNADYEIPKNYKNVFVIDKLEDLKIDEKRVQKIFLHSMHPKSAVPYLIQNKHLLKYCYWIVWGYDIYSAAKDSEEALYVKNNVKAVITNFDKDVYHKKYNPDKKVLAYPFYPSVIQKKYLDNAIRVENDCITVQINNSADFSTIEMLEILSKFASENIRITTILSYAKTGFSEEIIKKGKELFGDKFNAITEYMPPKEYAEHLKNINILVLNQNRQQGVGNIRCNLYLGNKVFIKKEITTYKGFKDKGFIVFDTNEINSMDFKTFTDMKETEKETNKKLIQSYFDNTEILKSWEVFYND